MFKKLLAIGLIALAAACAPQSRSPDEAKRVVAEGLDLFTRGCIDNLGNLRAAEAVFEASGWPSRGKGRYGSLTEGFQAQVTRINSGVGIRCTVIATGVTPEMFADALRPVVLERFGDRAVENEKDRVAGKPASWDIQGYPTRRLVGAGVSHPGLVSAEFF